MLKLTRGVGETIRIGDKIIIKIKGIRQSNVVFCIEAPTSTTIHRSELYFKFKASHACKPVRKTDSNLSQDDLSLELASI